MPQRIAVIGAGVLGLAVAQSLSRRGAQVTVFDKNYPGSGTSQISYAWVNANGKEPTSYHDLNAHAIDEHKRWQASHPASPRWLLETGTLEWQPMNHPCASWRSAQQSLRRSITP